MSQNTSSAVMAQRKEPHDSLDDFPTPPWATRALIEHVIKPHYRSLELPCNVDLSDYMESLTVWEPACNRGYMAEPLKEYFDCVHTSDIHDYGYGDKVSDFLFPIPFDFVDVDWVITNPPFRLAEQFIDRAFHLSLEGVAMIVRTSFLEGVGRYERLFTKNPPSVIAQFAERVPMVKGRLTEKGSTATAYCWLVWVMGKEGTEFKWIPPCRKSLEYAGDYPEVETANG